MHYANWKPTQQRPLFTVDWPIRYGTFIKDQSLHCLKINYAVVREVPETVNIYLHIYLFLSVWILRAPEGAIDPALLKEHDPLISCGVGGRGRGGDRRPLPLLLLLHQGHVARRRTPARRPSWDHLRLRPRRDLLQGSRDAGAGGGRGVRTSRMRTKDVREVSRSEGVDGRRAGNGLPYPCV